MSDTETIYDDNGQVMMNIISEVKWKIQNFVLLDKTVYTV